jgi:hydroxyacylglutathione hydrolase
MLPPPQYFPKNAMMNKTGYDSFDAVVDRGLQALTAEEVKQQQANGALVLDVRNQDEYIRGFIKNSQFIGLNGTFAMWVGALIEDIRQPIVLVVPEGKEEEAVTRLARVGYDHCVGYLKGGIDAWKAAGEPVETITSVPAESLESVFDTISLVDVRKPGEWSAEHVDGATHYALDFMPENLNVLDKNKTYHIHCAGGYRSVIAISLLMRSGYKNLIDVAGGYGAIKKTALPVTDFVCSSKG